MTILFVLFTFLIIMTVTYLVRRPDEAVEQVPIIASPSAPRFVRDFGFDIPQNYAYHPGHTWVVDEGRQNARVGMDSFAANLLGRIDKLEVTGLNRWVRQGQKLITTTSGDVKVDLVSPVEGVVIAINPEVLRDPTLVGRDAYKSGWVCMVKSPDLKTNLKNLVTGKLVGAWMQNSVRNVNTAAAGGLATAADGGLPVPGLLAQLTPEQRADVIREVFLTEQ